jgi:hypothetical protein
VSFSRNVVLGVLASTTLAAAPVSAGGYYHGGYHGGYYPAPYYYNNGGAVAAALIGGLLFGGLIGAASTSHAATVPPPPPPVPNGFASSSTITTVPTQQAGSQQDGQAQPQVDDAATAQVELCSRAAERTAQGNGGYARVVAIQGIDGNQASALVHGTIELNPGNGGAVTNSPFTCAASYGSVTNIHLG